MPPVLEDIRKNFRKGTAICALLCKSQTFRELVAKADALGVSVNAGWGNAGHTDYNKRTVVAHDLADDSGAANVAVMGLICFELNNAVRSDRFLDLDRQKDIDARTYAERKIRIEVEGMKTTAEICAELLRDVLQPNGIGEDAVEICKRRFFHRSMYLNEQLVPYDLVVRAVFEAGHGKTYKEQFNKLH